MGRDACQTDIRLPFYHVAWFNLSWIATVGGKKGKDIHKSRRAIANESPQHGSPFLRRDRPSYVHYRQCQVHGDPLKTGIRPKRSHEVLAGTGVIRTSKN